MKSFIIFFFIFGLLFSINFCQTPPTPKTFWYDQVIDHFDFNTKPATFKQQYLVYDGYFDKTNGPIFLYTGNEGPIESFYDNSGYVFTLAEEFKALVVFIEHRYYGKSQPFGHQSHTQDNIRYLFIEQVLDDYAAFIEFLRHDFVQRADAALITFGGSYGGSLSAYMRMHHPNLVNGSLAASAPIFLYEGYTNPDAYMAQVTADFQHAKPGCRSIVELAYDKITELQAARKYNQIQQELKLCEAPKSSSDVDNIKMWIRNAFVNLAMLDYPYPTDFEAPLPAWPVDAACEVLVKGDLSPISRIGQAAGVFYNGTQALPCFNLTAEFFICSDPSGCGGSRTDVNALSWDYQACTEMIHDIGTNNITDMFPAVPWTVKSLSDYCQKTWNVAPRPLWMPRFNTPLQTASKIIFSNGALDPWHVGGVLSLEGAKERQIELIWIENAAHHLDLRYPNPQDPHSVTEARKKEMDIIRGWLTQHHHHHFE